MTSKAPPVPQDQQSDKIRGASSPPDAHPEVTQDPAGGDADINLSQQGRYGGTIQNTTNQGKQQDR